MKYRIAVDTGGTFTDLALANEDKIVGVFKSPTTSEDVFRGIAGSLARAASAEGKSSEDLLSQTQSFVYATTHGTNAILQGAVPRTAFVTTKGHRDILTYREGGKVNLYDLRQSSPQPYVPRWLTFELTERIVSDGSVDIPLRDDEVRAVLNRLGEVGVDAIGVCLLWSPVNAEHEIRVGELIDELLPGVEYTLSHRLNPVLREYRRASATVIDASIKRPMREHLQSVEHRLRDLGFGGEPVAVTHRSGGVLFFDTMAEFPIYSVDSGPALAPVAASVYMKAETQYEDAIVVDAGGTSFDVSVIRDKQITYTPEKWLGPRWTGHLTGVSAVDTRSIGAGGGSIAWIDKGGLLHVGPESAGARPGPACYGLGGKRPTVTDAALVLGYLDPAYFLGGLFHLSVPAARTAIERHIAEPLDTSTELAADAILRLAAESMHTLIRELTIDHGLDPRDCLLVAGGGASGLVVAVIARELGCRRVLIPSTAAGLSAVGGHYSDFVVDFSRAVFTTSRAFDFDRVNATLGELAAEIDSFFHELTITTGTAIDALEKEFVLEARYAHQVWELDVLLGSEPVFRTADDVRALELTFHRIHQEMFAVSEPGQYLECISWRGRGRLPRAKPDLAHPGLGPDRARRRDEVGDIMSAPRFRRAVFGGEEVVECPVYYGNALTPTLPVAGPAIVEEPDTTIIVIPGTRIERTPHGNYALTVDDRLAHLDTFEKVAGLEMAEGRLS